MSATAAEQVSGRGVRTDLVERVRRRLAGTGTAATPAAVAAILREETAGLVGDADLLALLRVAQAEICGTGPLDPLLADPDTTDVLVNGPAEVWIDGDRGLRRTDVRFPDEESVRRLAQRLAASAGRRLDDAQPWVDATLPDGTRMHAVLPPVAQAGTYLSLRLSRHRPFTLARLVELGTLTEHSAWLVDAVVRARLAFLVSGGTGSGKTTLLSSLLGRVDPAERLVMVEDAAELRPDHGHVVRLTARPPNVEGAGEVTLRDLVRQALRMRPDRLVVGEVRGGEVVELIGTKRHIPVRGDHGHEDDLDVTRCPADNLRAAAGGRGLAEGLPLARVAPRGRLRLLGDGPT